MDTKNATVDTENFNRSGKGAQAVLQFLKEASEIQRIPEENFNQWALEFLIIFLGGHVDGRLDVNEYLQTYLENTENES